MMQAAACADAMVASSAVGASRPKAKTVVQIEPKFGKPSSLLAAETQPHASAFRIRLYGDDGGN
jgi:hypothetical protein